MHNNLRKKLPPVITLIIIIINFILNVYHCFVVNRKNFEEGLTIIKQKKTIWYYHVDIKNTLINWYQLLIVDYSEN